MVNVIVPGCFVMKRGSSKRGNEKEGQVVKQLSKRAREVRWSVRWMDSNGNLDDNIEE